MKKMMKTMTDYLNRLMSGEVCDTIVDIGFSVVAGKEFLQCIDGRLFPDPDVESVGERSSASCPTVVASFSQSITGLFFRSRF